MSWTVRGDQELRVRVARADQLESTLFSILYLVVDWLKFAEAKNGGVVGLASATIALLLGYLSEAGPIPLPAGIVLAFGAASFLLSLLIGVGSFLPKMNALKVVEGRQGIPTGTDNLFFFGHAAKYSPLHLAEAVARRYVGVKPDAVSEEHLALASQIITNARIALWKLRLFEIAVALFGMGAVVSALGVGMLLID